MMVTVTIPTFDTPPELLEKAVDGVLHQTHRDVRVIVIGDGDPVPDLDGDPRLTCVTLDENVGRYAIDAACVQVIGDGWWIPHDSDDYADPDWIAALLDTATEWERQRGERPGAVLADYLMVPMKGRPRRYPVKNLDPDGQMSFHAHMASLWDARSAADWVCDRWRIGWDAVMTGIPLLQDRAAICRTPGYVRVHRPGSLVHSRATGWGSAARNQVRDDLRPVWQQLVADPDQAASIVGELRSASGAVERAAEQIQAALDTHRAAPLEALPPRRITTTDVTSTGWAVGTWAAVELAGRLADVEPDVAVEAGSGASTLVFAEHARRTQLDVTSLEAHPEWLRRTRRLLASRGLSGWVDLRGAPLADRDAGPWYDTDLPDGVGFALIDGPRSQDGGRAAALPALWDRLDGWELLLDDAHRPQETEALEQWCRDFPVQVTLVDRLARVTPSWLTIPEIDARDVAVTILTGGRPQLLAKTLKAARAHTRGLLETADVTVVHNGADGATAEIIARHQDVLDRLEVVRPLGPIGENVTRCAQAAIDTGLPYWLHLEDDWAAATHDRNWLHHARDALEHAAQVRLRHASEKVLAQSMVTGDPIRWRARSPFVEVADAHWTFNPSLVRTEHAEVIEGCRTEKDAQRRAHEAGLRTVAQLWPGVFRHIGGVESLRARTGST